MISLPASKKSKSKSKSKLSLSIDIETSAPIPVTKVGAFKYAEQPDLQIVCMAWKLGSTPIQLWDVLSGESMPAQVLDHVSNGGLINAFNAGFEMSVLSNHAGRGIGWPRTKVSQWRDTAAKVASHGLPRSLGNAAIALPGIPHKDEAGKKVMLALSKPAGLAKATPEQLAILHNYCKNDVLVEYSIDQVLPKLPDIEQQLWELDYLINKRGILIDLPLVRQIAALIEKYTSSKIARCIELTGARPSQRKVVMAWCEDQGYLLNGYTADDITDALKDKDCPAPVVEVLQIRQATAFAAVKKYAAFENGACADGRLRGMFLYHGAATGRWTGRGAQLHNLSRPVLLKKPEQLEDAIKRIQEARYPVDLDKHVLVAFKDLVRSVLIAKPGCVFDVSDFSSIEARVLGWMANDPIYQRAFAEELDLYVVTAAMIYGIPMDQIDDDQRWLGKTCVLGLGYAMGLKKFIETVAKSGRVVPDALLAKAHAAYRATYKPIVSLWYAFGDAAIKAMRTGAIQRVGKCMLGFVKRGAVEFLYTQLPSGRRIAYYMPEIKAMMTPWGEMREGFTCLALNEKTKQLDRSQIHGGLLAQHATQSIARDLLADALLRSKKLDVVGHVHDEILEERPVGQTSVLAGLMSIAPSWAPGLYIKAHGFESARYRK